MEDNIAASPQRGTLGDIGVGTVLQLFVGFPLLLVLEFALRKTLAGPRGYTEILFAIWLILLPVTNICRGRFAPAFGNLVGILILYAIFFAYCLWIIRMGFIVISRKSI